MRITISTTEGHAHKGRMRYTTVGMRALLVSFLATHFVSFSPDQAAKVIHDHDSPQDVHLVCVVVFYRCFILVQCLCVYIWVLVTK